MLCNGLRQRNNQKGAAHTREASLTLAQACPLCDISPAGKTEPYSKKGMLTTQVIRVGAATDRYAVDHCACTLVQVLHVVINRISTSNASIIAFQVNRVERHFPQGVDEKKVGG